jgi:hypothetical protein
MFTPEEIEFLIPVIRAKLKDTETHTLAQSVLAKLLCIDDYSVSLFCASCKSWEYVEEFSQGHACRRCGRRICDDCHKAYGDLCDDCEHLPPDLEDAFYEAADVLRDWAVDR